MALADRHRDRRYTGVGFAEACTMTPGKLWISRDLLINCLHWFLPEFNRTVVFPLHSQFPDYPLPGEVQATVRYAEDIIGLLSGHPPGDVDVRSLVAEQLPADPGRPPFFKQAVLLYRRSRATYVEGLLGKTFNLELTATLKQQVEALDALCRQDWFQEIPAVPPLPRLKNYLSVQFIEESTKDLALPPREYDEKFHILQAPTLFLKDLNHFRSKCEDRDVPVAIAFLDIDDFKGFNTRHTEPVVDRNLLPRLMRELEAHVYHHGYAYRQGGDEYLVVLPSMSRILAVTFLDQLRTKVADLEYPEIDGAPTLSIGFCLAEPGSPLTDRELLDRASQAKKFAKENGKNRIATFDGPRLSPDELRVVTPVD
jgi:diguanylate cyclase (GGDEF)-like protein